MKLGPALVMTPDLDEAKRFYCDVLGLKLVQHFDDQRVFDLGGSPLHVFRCQHPASPVRHGAQAASVLCFEVVGLETVMRELAAKGVVFLHERPAHNAQAGLAYAAFHAPGGNVHELVERLADTVTKVVQSRPRA